MEPEEIRQKNLRNDELLKKSVKQILKSIGEDPNREGLKRTPYRVAKAYEEWFGGYGKKPEDILDRQFNTGHKISGMVIIPNINFYSHCEHHVTPFWGHVDIGYIPKKNVSGLDKFIKLVEIYARRLQIQERMTEQIAEAINKILKPKGCMVVSKAVHFCVRSRGTKNQTSSMTYSAIRGCFKSQDVRDEFLRLIGNGNGK